jgi:hypothetical protein
VRPRFMRRLHYWWSMFAAGALLLFLAPPNPFVFMVGEQTRSRLSVGIFWRSRLAVSKRRPHKSQRARATRSKTNIRLRLQSSFLLRYCCDIYLHRKDESVSSRRRGFLKVPILGVGMGFVNVMATRSFKSVSAITND